MRKRGDEEIRAEIIRRAERAFGADAAGDPPMTLRGGAALDSYEAPPPPDAKIDDLSDEYLENYAFWGLPHLDPASWRHCLPSLISYALRRMDDPKMAAEGLIHSLRPPDRDPPRLAALSAEQEGAIVALLEEMAFSEGFATQGLAMMALGEWWIPEALFRRDSASGRGEDTPGEEGPLGSESIGRLA